MDNDKSESTKLIYHHVAILVDDMASSISHYSDLFGKENISDVINVTTQKVNICFVKIADSTYIELVEPIGQDSLVYKLLKKRITYYHVGYKVADIKATVLKLEKMNYKAMEFYKSEAFEGKECVFLFSPDAHLIELMER